MWVKRQGRGNQTRINQVLRRYMSVGRRAASVPDARTQSLFGAPKDFGAARDVCKSQTGKPTLNAQVFRKMADEVSSLSTVAEGPDAVVVRG